MSRSIEGWVALVFGALAAGVEYVVASGEVTGLWGTVLGAVGVVLAIVAGKLGFSRPSDTEAIREQREGERPLANRPPPTPLLALCLVMPLIGACGLTQQQRVQTARDTTCAASVSTLEAVEVAAPLCESDQCLDRLDKVRAAAMQAASIACEERADNAETISRPNRPLSQLRDARRGVPFGATGGGRGGSAQRYGDHRLRAQSDGDLFQSGRVRRGTDARKMELAAAGVAGEERT